MKEEGSYVPPPYVPLKQFDQEEAEAVTAGSIDVQAPASINEGPVQWSSGICACCDDMPSCFVGLICPCYLFAKNAEFLGSETLIGPCMTHFLLWFLVSGTCCFYCMLLGLPGCLLSCYARNYRKNLRTKYNLPEAPCGDFTTHLFCHQCALCQEYREICERSGDCNFTDTKLPVVTAPAVQKMEPHSEESH